MDQDAGPEPCDALLTRTSDHAGARAVEVELGRQGVRCVRGEGRERVRREVELYVRRDDHARASRLAAMVFARRRRFGRISPRPAPAPDVAPDSIDLPIFFG